MIEDACTRWMFLLSVAGLAAGCPSDDAPAEEEGSSTTGDVNTGGMTMSPTTTPTPATSNTMPTATTAQPTTGDTTTGEPTTGEPTTGGSSSGEPTTGEPTSGSTTGEPTTDTTTGETSADTTDGPDVSSGGASTGAFDCEDVELPEVGEISDACVDYFANIEDCYGEFPPYCLPLYEAFCQYYIEYYAAAYGEACGGALEDYYACVATLDCDELKDGCTDEIDTVTETCGF